MIDRETFFKGIEETIKTPFRVVPFFDPAPWGGQWMKEVCGLDLNKPTTAGASTAYRKRTAFSCKSMANCSKYRPTIGVLPDPRLAWRSVESRFGQDFPIRFDFLDTMGGGNLSLQVHPTTQYIRDTFGIYYTQDESYYLLDAEEGVLSTSA